MSSPHDQFRKVWRVPAELREDVRGEVLDVLRGNHDISTRGRVTRERYEVSWDGHGRLFVRWGDEPHAPGTWLMLEGRSRWESLVRQLELIEVSERKVHRMTLEVDVIPGVEFELDDEDLEVMEYALAKIYGHMIRVHLTLGEGEQEG